MPDFLVELFTSLSDPDFVANIAPMKLKGAIRQKLLDRNDTFGLSGKSLEELASAPDIQLSQDLNAEELEYLATSFVSMFEANIEAHRRLGFLDPVRPAVQLMMKFQLKA